MKLDIHIYGLHERDDTLKPLAKKLNMKATNIHYDDRKKENRGGCLYAAKRAWLADASKNITHRIVLPDDVDICDNFVDICQKIIETHPNKVISLFPFDFMEKTDGVDKVETPYFIARHLTGAGIIMPIEYIEPCFKYIDSCSRFSDNSPDDEAIQSWLDMNNIPIITTIPAILQHIGDNSIVTKNAPIRRTVYFEKNPVASWDCKQYVKISDVEWFFSNHGIKPDKTYKIKIFE